MQDSDSKEHPPRTKVVKNAAAAALLTDPRALGYLDPFLDADHTLSTAAAAIGVSPSTLAYWIPKLVDAGLIHVARRQRRAGMVSPVYRGVAPRILVPNSALSMESAFRFIERSRRDMDDRFARSLTRAVAGGHPWVLEITRHGDSGGIATRVLPAERPPRRVAPVLDRFDALQLRHDDAIALVAELNAVVSRYEARGHRGALYLIHLGVAPHHHG